MKFDLSEPIFPWVLFASSLSVILILLIRRKKPKPSGQQEVWGSEVVLGLRAQLRRQQETVREQIEFFVNFPEVIKTLAGAVTIDEVTAAMSRGIQTLLGCNRIGIFLAHVDKKLRLTDGTGFDREYRGTYTCPLQTPELLPILKHRSVSEIKDHEVARRFLEPLTLSPNLAASMWYGERLLGLLVISEPTVDPQTARRIFAMLADLMSVSLHAAGLVAEIRRKAEQDDLTGLPNRRTLTDRVTVEIERCDAYHSKFSLAMAEVDHFNQYTDQNGRAAGDEALKKAALLIRGGLRRTDFAARYGSEEFALVLKSADHNDAGRTAERIRRLIEQADFPFGKQQPSGFISVSIGVASFPDDAKDSAALFRAADDALSRAKKAGGNRVVVHDASIQIDECCVDR